MCFYCLLLFLMCTLVVHRYFLFVLCWCLSICLCALIAHPLLLIVLCCCLLGLLCCVLLLLVRTPCCICWCSSMSPWYALFVFIGSSLLCFINVHWHILVVPCWCLPMCPCYALLVVINMSLLCSIGACWHLHVMLYCCSLAPPCCIS